VGTETSEGRAPSRPLPADRGDRLTAHLADWATFWFWWLGVGLCTALFLESGKDGVGLVEGLGVVAWLALQCALLVRHGQTIGKWACGVRVVDAADGRAVGFVRVVLVRSLVPWGVLLALLVSDASFEWSLPLSDSSTIHGAGIGWFVVLFDAVWIFGRERRCLHDHLARTRVVRCAEPSRRRAERRSLASSR